VIVKGFHFGPEVSFHLFPPFDPSAAVIFMTVAPDLSRTLLHTRTHHSRAEGDRKLSVPIIIIIALSESGAHSLSLHVEARPQSFSSAHSP
jgi:hypothetical protein